MVIYIIHKCYREQLPFRKKRKETPTQFVLFLISAHCNGAKQKWLHSFTRDADERFSRSSSMAVGWRWQTDNHQTTTQRNVHNQEMSYTVFPQCTSVHLRVCLWTTYKTLLLLLDICYSVHVTAPAKTLIVLKGHDRVCNVCLHMYSIWRDVLNLRSGFFFPVCCAFYLKRVGDTSAVEKSAFSWI